MTVDSAYLSDCIVCHVKAFADVIRNTTTLCLEVPAMSLVGIIWSDNIEHELGNALK